MPSCCSCSSDAQLLLLQLYGLLAGLPRRLHTLLLALHGGFHRLFLHLELLSQVLLLLLERLPCRIRLADRLLLRRLAIAAVFDIAVEHGQFLAAGRQGLLAFLPCRVRCLQLLIGLHLPLFAGFYRCMRFFQLRRRVLLLRLLLRQFALQLRELLRELLPGLGLRRVLLGQLRLTPCALFLPFAQRRHLAACRFQLAAQYLVLFRLLLHSLLKVRDGLADERLAGLGLLHGRTGREHFVLRRLQLRRILRLLRCDLRIGMRKAAETALVVLTLQRLPLARLLRLFRERFQLFAELADDVLHAHEILLRVVQLAQGLALAVAVLRDTRRLLEEAAPFLRPRIEDGVDAVLPDDAHAIVADARVGKEIVDILQAAAAVVDEEFTLAAAVKATRHHDLAEVHGQCLVAVIQHERDLRHAQCMAAGRAREDDILGACAAQVAHVLLPQYPADGVGDVALARAVRSHDGRDALIEVERYLIGE